MAIFNTVYGGELKKLRTTLPTTPSYNDYYFNLAFIPKDDSSYYAWYILAWGNNGIYALDMYSETSSWVSLWNIWSTNFWFDQTWIRVAKWNQVIARNWQRTNTYCVYDFTNETPTYATTTATNLPTNTYSDFSYINTYSGIFVQKDWNTSSTAGSASWRDYNWDNKSVNSNWDLSNVGQAAFCADDIINPKFLWRWGGSNYTSRWNTIFKYDIENRTMTQISQTLSSNSAVNQPFYYNWYVFFPIKSDINSATTSVYKFDTSTLTWTTITTSFTLNWYSNRRQFYIWKYLYIFPSNEQWIVVDMSTL